VNKQQDHLFNTSVTITKLSFYITLDLSYLLKRRGRFQEKYYVYLESLIWNLQAHIIKVNKVSENKNFLIPTKISFKH